MQVDRSISEVLRIDAWYQGYSDLSDSNLNTSTCRSSTNQVPSRILHFRIRSIKIYKSAINKLVSSPALVLPLESWRTEHGSSANLGQTHFNWTYRLIRRFTTFSTYPGWNHTITDPGMYHRKTQYEKENDIKVDSPQSRKPKKRR